MTSSCGKGAELLVERRPFDGDSGTEDFNFGQFAIRRVFQPANKLG